MNHNQITQFNLAILDLDNKIRALENNGLISFYCNGLLLINGNSDSIIREILLTRLKEEKELLIKRNLINP